MNVWEIIDKNLQIDGNYVGLYGPPGTGKTHAAATLGLAPTDGLIEVSVKENGSTEVEARNVDRETQRVLSLTLTDGASEAELRGHYIPTETGGEWIDGPAVRAWKLSHSQKIRLVINEVDRASDEVLGFLYAVADDPRSPGTMLTLPNHLRETITPGPGFTVVVTMNGEPEDLPEALQDRFKWLYVGSVNPAALATLPGHLRGPAESAALAEGARRVSIRRWLGFQFLLENGLSEQEAAFTAFGHDRWRDVLDTILAAKSVSRVAAIPPGGPVENYQFDTRFTSFEDISRTVNHYCGWCHTVTCEADDGECKPMRFADQSEHEDFCAAYGLPSDDTHESVRKVWRESMLRRTRSRQMSPETVEDLARVTLGG
jgi:hypothetical protein